MIWNQKNLLSETCGLTFNSLKSSCKQISSFSNTILHWNQFLFVNQIQKVTEKAKKNVVRKWSGLFANDSFAFVVLPLLWKPE